MIFQCFIISCPKWSVHIFHIYSCRNDTLTEYLSKWRMERVVGTCTRELAEEEALNGKQKEKDTIKSLFYPILL